jgi:predicted nucleotidyltransferase
MTTTLLDLSGKIDKVAVSALSRIHQISSSMKIPFFIVGATARDILLEVHYGIGSKRATLDIDIAVFIENWEQFNHLKDELIGIKHFTPTRDIQRLLGRDISKIAYTSTMSKLIEILKRESKRQRGHGIAMDVLLGDRFADESYEKVSAYFDALLKGLTDHKNP